MKLLLVGNHTCGNRGDAAILRGLLDTLRKLEANLEIDILSRYSKKVQNIFWGDNYSRSSFDKTSKKKAGHYQSFSIKLKTSVCRLL